MQRIAQSWNIAFIVLRLVIACYWFQYLHGALWIFWLAEIFALCMTARATLRARLDVSRLGMLLPICYLTVWLFIPSKDANPLGAACLAFASIAQTVMIFSMRDRVTIGVAHWRKLLDTGAYSLVRHPVSACELACAASMLLTFPVAWNLLAFAIRVVAVFAAIAIEERFLLQFYQYQDYRRRVPWRIMPGIV